MGTPRPTTVSAALICLMFIYFTSMLMSYNFKVDFFAWFLSADSSSALKVTLTSIKELIVNADHIHLSFFVLNIHFALHFFDTQTSKTFQDETGLLWWVTDSREKNPKKSDK